MRHIPVPNDDLDNCTEEQLDSFLNNLQAHTTAAMLAREKRRKEKRIQKLEEAHTHIQAAIKILEPMCHDLGGSKILASFYDARRHLQLELKP